MSIPRTPPDMGSLPSPKPSGSGGTKDRYRIESEPLEREQIPNGDKPSNDGMKTEILPQQQPTPQIVAEHVEDVLNGNIQDDPTKEIARLRSLVSHYQLQNKLLTIESYENAQRYEVENSIMQREIDRLIIERSSFVESQSQSLILSSVGANGETAAQTYRRRLRKAKMKLHEKDIELRTLKQRLKESRLERREHRPGQHLAKGKDSAALTANNNVNSNVNNNKADDDDTFDKGGLAALGALASQFLGRSNDQAEESSRSTLLSPVQMRRTSVASTSTISMCDEPDHERGMYKNEVGDGEGEGEVEVEVEVEDEEVEEKEDE